MSNLHNTEIHLSTAARSDRKQWWAIIFAMACGATFWIDTWDISANFHADVRLLEYFFGLAAIANVCGILYRTLDKYSLLEIGDAGIRMRIHRFPFSPNTNHEIFVPWTALTELSFHKTRIEELVFHLTSETPGEFGFTPFELRPTPWLPSRRRASGAEKSQATILVNCFEIRPREFLPLVERQIAYARANLES